MRAPLSWLADYVEIGLSPEALADRLTQLGMEVQKIERRGGDWRSVVVGELLDVRPHPNAERLSLTSVAFGDGTTPLSIVCGATNIAVGQRVPVALPGAVLPGEREITVSTIAGEQSQGMLCSGDELRLTDDAEGILILPPDAPLGTPLAEMYGDVILDIDVKPNRGDALSLIGLAREVAAATGSQLRWPPVDPQESGDSTAAHLRVDVREPGLCPRFVGRYLDGVTVQPSPLEVQLRLTAAGMRPVSNVVDATNYAMLELGKPTHAFDAAAITDGRLVVRRARDGETLETLDHAIRTLSAEMLVIADPSRALGIAGVIGGASSEVGPGTTAVAIESAIFDPVSIRRTVQALGMSKSEASLRFEKGQEWRLAPVAADRVARLISAWGGARVARGLVDSNPREQQPSRVAFRPARVRRLLGADLPTPEMQSLLRRVEIGSEPAPPGTAVPVTRGERPLDALPADGDEVLLATIPSHRRDVEVEADIAEEIIRIRGYETVPSRRPDTPMPPYRPDPLAFEDRVRSLLSGHGLNEIVAHALVAPVDHERLGLRADDPETIRVLNPVAVDHSELRRSLLAGLVRRLSVNERQRRRDAGFFEVGRVHRFDRGQPRETNRLAILLAGDRPLPSWNQEAHHADFWDVSGIVSWLCERLRVPSVRLEPAEALDGVEHPGRAAVVTVIAERTKAAGGRVGGTKIGRVAELHPRYLAAYEVRAARVAVAELDLAPLARLVPAWVRFAPVTRLPIAERDIAVIVPETTPSAAVEEIVRDVARPVLRGARLFDRYQGSPLGSGEVSLAYRLQLQGDERTLTDAELDQTLAAVVRALEQRLGARLRG